MKMRDCQLLGMQKPNVQGNLVASLHALPSLGTPDMMRILSDHQGPAFQLARWQRRARQRRHQGLQHPSQQPAPPQQCTLAAASLWGRPCAPGVRERPHLCRRRLAASRSAPLITALRTCLISYSILKQSLHKLGTAQFFCEEPDLFLQGPPGLSVSAKPFQEGSDGGTLRS